MLAVYSSCSSCDTLLLTYLLTNLLTHGYKDESTYSVRAARAGFKPSFVLTMYPDPES